MGFSIFLVKINQTNQDLVFPYNKARKDLIIYEFNLIFNKLCKKLNQTKCDLVFMCLNQTKTKRFIIQDSKLKQPKHGGVLFNPN